MAAEAPLRMRWTAQSVRCAVGEGERRERKRGEATHEHGLLMGVEGVIVEPVAHALQLARHGRLLVVGLLVKVGLLEEGPTAHGATESIDADEDRAKARDPVRDLLGEVHDTGVRLRADGAKRRREGWVSCGEREKRGEEDVERTFCMPDKVCELASPYDGCSREGT